MSKTSQPLFVLSARAVATAALVTATFALAPPAEAAFLQTNLVSSIPGLATITDPLLINPWGSRAARRARSGFRTRAPTAARSTR